MSLRADAAKNRNEIDLYFSDVSFSITIKSNSENDRLKTTQRGSEKGSEKVFRLIKAEPQISASQMAVQISISQRAVEKSIAKLRRDKKLKQVGSARGGHWEGDEITNAKNSHTKKL